MILYIEDPKVSQKIIRAKKMSSYSQNPEHWQTPNDDKDVGQQELSFTADGNVKWYRDFGRQLTSFSQN